MTGSEVYAYVLRKFKRTDKETESYEAMTDVIADMRLQFLSAKYAEEAYLAISTLGEYRLPYPSDFGHFVGTITVTDTTDDSEIGILSKISKKKYDELYPDRLLTATSNMSVGVPQHFCVYGEQIFIGPVPDKITYRYSINYTTEDFTSIASDTADVPFSNKYRNILRAGVLSELHNGIENYDEAEYWAGKFGEGLSKIASSEKFDEQDDSAVEYSGF